GGHAVGVLLGAVGDTGRSVAQTLRGLEQLRSVLRDVLHALRQLLDAVLEALHELRPAIAVIRSAVVAIIGTATQRAPVLLLLEAVAGLVESARRSVQQPLGIGLLDALAHLVGSARRAHLGSCLVSLILGHDAGVDESVEVGVRSGQLIGLVRALFEAVAVLVQSVGETGGSLGHALCALVEFLAAVDQVVESSLIGIP